MTERGVYAVRRYYLLKAFAAGDACDGAMQSAWLGKQQSEPGTSLADDFPARSRLVAAGYSCVEDIYGADVNELRKRAGLTQREADAALAALEN